MTKNKQIIIEWVSYLILICLYVFLNETLSEHPMHIANFAGFIGVVIGHAGFPLVFSGIFVAIRFFFIKGKDGLYDFFAQTYWILTAVIHFLSKAGECLFYKDGFLPLLFVVPIILGALFWCDKHKKQIKG